MNYKVEKIKKILKANPIVKFAYLFGSRAKGIANKRSDWDIAIYFRKDPQKLSKWTVFSLEAELSKEIDTEVQITVLNNLDSPILKMQVLKNGVLVFAKNKKIYNQFYVDAINQYDDLKQIRKTCEDNILKGRIYA